MKDITRYQNLTFETLHKLIEDECKKGNSRIDLCKYKVGQKMQLFLEEKGFDYRVGRSGNWLSW